MVGPTWQAVEPCKAGCNHAGLFCKGAIDAPKHSILFVNKQRDAETPTRRKSGVGWISTKARDQSRTLFSVLL